MQIERGMGKGRESELHTEKKSEREVQIKRGMGEGREIELHIEKE